MSIIECPHCYGTIEIEALNCRIFRHAVLKESMQQVNPHASKQELEQLKELDKIYGCGGPFRISENNKAEICDYI